jgi:hypothetical protein
MERDVWQKSSRSGSNGACVEARSRGETVDVRDSKNPAGPMLTFGRTEWAAFVQAAKRGDFDQ